MLGAPLKTTLGILIGIEKFKISDSLLKSCRFAYRKYKAYLEERKATDVKSCKRKRGEEELVGLKKRKTELTENAAYLRKQSDKKSDKAEKSKAVNEQLALFTSANALRKAAKEEEEATELLFQRKSKRRRPL